jgi:uncharacterized protein YbaR (Trm112 family)
VISPELLELLCCPETRQDLRLADPALIEGLNRQVAAGSLKNRAGNIVTEKIDGGLVRTDGKYLYPIAHAIPVMLIDEAIPVG